MKKASMIAVGILSFSLLFLCILSLILLPKKQRTLKETVYETSIVTQTQPIYVYVEPQTEDTTAESSATNTEELHWIVKSYKEMIGVFDEKMQLIRIIEVYTKTLPEADRKLLEEGIVIRSKKEYNALMEDYTA